MTSDLRTYTGRLARITEILEPYLHVSEYVLATPESNPLDRLNGLACRWFDRRTAQPTVSVFIDELEDVDRPLASLREYVFLRHYVNALTAIVGNCQVSLSAPGDLTALVVPALEVGRSVGCAAYLDDFARPPLPDEWRPTNWGVGPGIPGFPPGPP